MRHAALTMLALLAGASSVTAGDKTETKSADNKLAVLERFAGEWVVDGKWSNGDTLHARNTYAWGLGKKIMTSRTFVKNGDKEYQRYEGIFAWHPEKKSLFHISFTFDGSISEVLVEAKDKDMLEIGLRPFAEGKESKVRQTIRFLDNDRYQWVVFLKNGDSWQQIIDATWKRKAK